MPASTTRLLVPIRYPITDKSAQTLARARELAMDRDDSTVEVLVLHVNLIQANDSAHEREIHRAVTPILDEVPFSVITRRAFLVEEAILDEAVSTMADVIIVGANQAPRWWRLVSRLLPSKPNIVGYLEQHIDPDVSVEVVA